MHEELKHSNSIGDLKGIQHFARTTLNNGKIKIEEARHLCSFLNGILLYFNSALALFHYLNFIKIIDTTLVPTDVGTQLSLQLNGNFEKMFSEICINKIIADGFINLDALKFETTQSHYYIQKYGFPLNSAVFRNTLIELGALIKQRNGTLLLAKDYENIFAKANKATKQKMSLDRLKKQLTQQSEQGEAAEIFVLEYELKRLNRTSKNKQIKRISEIDVTAGYDIVSYANDESQEYDRFIEVKSYHGQLHFYWSENEIKIASSLGDKYYIYLVDAEKISNKNYQPLIIRDPAYTIFKGDNWLIKPTSYLIIPVDTHIPLKNIDPTN